MDGYRFDALARSVAGLRTRRSVLRAVGVALGARIVGSANTADAAQTCRPGGTLCRKAAECCSGSCTPDATGRGRCADGQVCDNGRCTGTGCAVGEVGEAGACVCPGLDRSIAPFACCPGGGPAPATGGCSHVDFLLADTCQIISQCPSGYTECIGEQPAPPASQPCRVCCPSGTTCEQPFGICRL